MVAGVGGRGTVFGHAEPADSDHAKPADSDDDVDDEGPEVWSKYGVIDPATLEEDAEIEI